MGNLPTPSDCAVAFEAAVRELSRMYPPSKVPKNYPMDTTTGRYYTVFEEDLHSRMIHDASYGRVKEVLRSQYQSGIPRDELEAVIALIYG